MALKKQIWTALLLRAFRETPTFLSGVKDESSKVTQGVMEGGATIHMTDVGGDPTVLVNNSSYPIAASQRNDSDVALSLDKYETENTKVTKDELEALVYDKVKSVNEQHKEVLVEESHNRALHAFGPSADATATPVVQTTGSLRGSFKKLTIADLISLKKKFDDNKYPQRGRRLVLCPQHIADLLEISETFNKQYNLNTKEGKVPKLMGFEIHEWAKPVMYDSGGNKKAYGAAPSGTDKQGSVAFIVSRGFKAMTKPMRFLSKAEEDPQNRETLLGYRMWFLASPKSTSEAIGAIIDGA